KALSRLNELCKRRAAQKLCGALVKSKPETPQPTRTHFLKRNPKTNTSQAHIKELADSKKAVLDHRLIESLNTFHLLGIQRHTGRHPQIRCQLSAIGTPIKGDLKYGFDRSNPHGGIHLHARKLSFIHPVSKQKIEITAPLPNEKLWKSVEE